MGPGGKGKCDDDGGAQIRFAPSHAKTFDLNEAIKDSTSIILSIRKETAK